MGGGGPRILTVGKLKEEKDQQLLVRAFVQLPRELDARLMIAGDGSLLGQLQSLAQELGVANRVLFPGYVADCWPLYASANLFVLPSQEVIVRERARRGAPRRASDCQHSDDGSRGGSG